MFSGFFHLYLWVFSFATAAPLSERARHAWAEFESRERRFALVEGHASRVRVHVDSEKIPRRTPRAALLIPGLFNSPRHFGRIEDLLFDQGLNIVSLRMAGHYEVDRLILRKHVRWTTWLNQARRAFALAAELGDHVMLVGHSTGAVLNTWLATEHPDSVAGLALFAPAFGLHRMLLEILEYNRDLMVPLPGGRMKGLHAGRQVRELGLSFRDDLERRTGRPQFEGARELLADVPLWMANTDLDVVIDVKTAERFYAALIGSPSRRFSLYQSPAELVPHDWIASPLNRRLDELTQSLCATLLE